MQKLKVLTTSFSFIITLFTLLTFTLYFLPTKVNAQVPQIHLACTETADNEFHSLRPYQAAPCGDAPKARFCSNRLVIFEDFNVTGKNDCKAKGYPGNFTCHPNFQVQPHNLKINLDESEFPILGNTEDTMDDAQKVNEYASWYLNGVVDKKENKDTTDDQIVNFSGPVKKLLPSIIQDVQKIKIITEATTLTKFTDDTDKEPVQVQDAENHDQIVVDNLRLSSWSDGNLSLLNTFFNWLGTDVWNKKYPPLPWQFKTEVLYQKAYYEWRGKQCAILPRIGLTCIDIPGVTLNKWADNWRFIPLANTSDKKGANYLLTIDGPSYDPSDGTAIEGAQHETYTNAPLYFAHTQEVNDLSQLLNKTYTPAKYKSVQLPKSTEQNETTDPKLCTAVNIRSNQGDNLFPGDLPELSVTGVQYLITEAKCEEKEVPPPNNCGPYKNKPCPEEGNTTVKCNAEVGVIFELGTKTPWAKEIFGATVADSGSTFRKIYPKVDANAPVSCIADIPTSTGVTYDSSESQNPQGGVANPVRVKNIPEDSAASEDRPQLTFPHIGAVYEYFLKGIQTALRPQGYGNEQPISGQKCTNIQCGELPKGLPKASGSCALSSPSQQVGAIPQSLRDIVNAAAQTYKTPPGLILGVMYGEGLFNPGRFNWTDTNVKNWATCQKIPSCNESGDDNFMGFNGNDFANISKHIAADLKKVDPTRKEPNVCNLMDTIYAVAWNLHDSADGGGGLPKSCFGIDLKASVPNSCTWNDNQYESAIKVHESGYTNYCLTKEGSCATGGGLDAACATGDTCETKDTRYLNPSHNACVWDAAHGTGAGRR